MASLSLPGKRAGARKAQKDFMKHTVAFLMSGFLLTNAAFAAEQALTIYNQDFAVVRDVVPLDLKPGINHVRFADASAFLEASSVTLRDPAGRQKFQILEQNFRGDPISQELLLSLNEGKVIPFEVMTQDGAQTTRKIVSGKIIRSGYDPRIGREGYYGYPGNTGVSQPIIEVDGRLRFSLPGQPLFPALADNTILKPTLSWEIQADQPAKFNAELGYVTGGMRWDADYNLILPEKGDVLDLIGWVTMDNQSGKSFEQARIKLMAGDVNKVQDVDGLRRQFAIGGAFGGAGGAPVVTEKAFDEYHLYTLERPATLLDKEKKQVEFVRAEGVKSRPLYIYDGAKQQQPEDFYFSTPFTQPDYGTESINKVWVMRELANSASNHLGLPLPKGKMRLYRRDADSQLEFVGENVIDHTPKDEIIRIRTGNAFDLVGERKRTDFNANFSDNPGVISMIDPNTGLPIASGSSTNISSGPCFDESFKITLRNHKSEPVEIRVVEHLYRWNNWQITKKSGDCRKIDAQTVEFPVQVKPDGEQELTYTVHYSW